jgi:flagellum-specific peptidoglycan hydrolase FlgJ
MASFPQSVITSAQGQESKWGIPASLTLAQWACESNWGKSVTGKNNFGGKKAKLERPVRLPAAGVPSEAATLCWTHETINGVSVRCQQWFKDYPTPDAWFDDHAKLLATGSPYRAAYQAMKAGGGPADPERVRSFTVAIAKRYATAPNYAHTLLGIMRQHNLYQYNRFATQLD